MPGVYVRSIIFGAGKKQMSDIRNYLTVLAAGLVAFLLPIVAHAATFGFTNQVSNNGNPYVGGQLFVDVAAVDATHVSFTFSNVGPIASSIADIYFTKPPLFSAMTSIGNNVGINGVDFSEGATPPGLPAGFNQNAVAFSADSNPPVEQNGINPGESLAIVFSLLAGQSLGSVIDAIVANTLRIGLHVQAIGNTGGSKSYLVTATPIPGALPLFVTGLVSLGLLRRRQRKARAL